LDQQLKEILDLLHRHDITYWLDSGTLLGLMREGKLLKNDMDIDVGVWSEEEQKLKKMLSLIKQAGYTIYSASYKGQIFKYNFIPNYNKHKRKVDINLFREADHHAWCPMYYFIFTSNHEKSEDRGRKFSGAVRKVIRSWWNRFNTKIRLKVDINSFPWRPFLNIGTWWIPIQYFKKIEYDTRLKAYIPSDWESYLEFRYGRWQVKKNDWIFYKDDQGINDKEPAEIIKQLKH